MGVVKHNESNHRTGTLTVEYMTWARMISRCYYPKNPSFSRYGAKGITVCQEWREDYTVFLRDMGRRPLGHSLDRIDPKGSYNPSNCRWATFKEQSMNQTRRNVCKMGHPFNYTDPHGDRSCRICKRERDRKYREKRVLRGW